MKNVAMVTGVLLIIIGVAGYAVPSETVTEGTDGPVVEQKRSITALIPAFAGLPILLCGVIAAVNPAQNKQAMHIAVTFGLLGALAATSRGVMSLLKFAQAEGEFNQRAFVFLALMAVVCWIFVVMCVMSLIKARKATQTSNARAEPEA